MQHLYNSRHFKSKNNQINNSTWYVCSTPNPQNLLSSYTTIHTCSQFQKPSKTNYLALHTNSIYFSLHQPKHKGRPNFQISHNTLDGQISLRLKNQKKQRFLQSIHIQTKKCTQQPQIHYPYHNTQECYTLPGHDIPEQPKDKQIHSNTNSLNQHIGSITNKITTSHPSLTKNN